MRLFRSNPMNSRMAEGVGRVGFRKWYERELLSSHAYLVLAFLSVIGLIGSMEAFGSGSSYDKVTNVVFVVVCAAVGGWALRRYLFLLMRAEDSGEPGQLLGLRRIRALHGRGRTTEAARKPRSAAASAPIDG